LRAQFDLLGRKQASAIITDPSIAVLHVLDLQREKLGLLALSIIRPGELPTGFGPALFIGDDRFAYILTRLCNGITQDALSAV